MMARELLTRNGLIVQQGDAETKDTPRILLRANSRPVNISATTYTTPEKKSCCWQGWQWRTLSLSWMLMNNEEWEKIQKCLNLDNHQQGPWKDMRTWGLMKFGQISESIEKSVQCFLWGATFSRKRWWWWVWSVFWESYSQPVWRFCAWAGIILSSDALGVFLSLYYQHHSNTAFIWLLVKTEKHLLASNVSSWTKQMRFPICFLSGTIGLCVVIYPAPLSGFSLLIKHFPDSCMLLKDSWVFHPSDLCDEFRASAAALRMKNENLLWAKTLWITHCCNNKCLWMCSPHTDEAGLTYREKQGSSRGFD